MSGTLIEQSLLLLNILGMNPKNLRNRIRALVPVISLSFLLVELTLDLTFNWKGWDSVNSFAAVGSFSQMVFKVCFMITNGGKIKTLLSKFETFWILQDSDENLQKDVKNTMNFVNKFLLFYGGAIGACLIAYPGKPLLTTNKTLPLQTYHPVDLSINSSYILMYIIQMIGMASGCLSVFSFDHLFITIITRIVCELKMIKWKFSNIDIGENAKNNDKECLKKMSVLVNHHNFVLSCTQDINSIYSFLILYQFVNSGSLLCTAMLDMITTGFPPDLQHLSTLVSFMMSANGQIFIYCLLGTYLATECNSVSDAVYDSDWWAKTQPEMRRSCVLVIQRANREAKLSVGGMFDLNLESFTKIERVSLSFFTLAQAMYTSSYNK